MLLVRSITNVSEKFDRYFLPFIFPPFIVPRMNNISSVREFDTRLCKLDTVQTAQCHVRCRVTLPLYARAGNHEIQIFKFETCYVNWTYSKCGVVQGKCYRLQEIRNARHSLPSSLRSRTRLHRSSICTYSYFIPFPLLIIFEKKEKDTFPCGSSHPRTRYEAYFLYYLIPVSIEANRISNLICLKIVCA